MADLKSGEKYIINPNFVVEEGHGAKEFFCKMNALRQTSANSCDITIKVRDKTFPAHKIVLAAFSPYLEKVVFDHDICTPLGINFTGTLTPETFQLLLDYAYTCKIIITAANVEPLLCASCRLEVSPLKNICEEYLGKTIDQDNFVKMYELACELACEVLYDFFNRFMRKKFMEIWEGNTFLELQPDMLIDIIKSDDLEVRSEETVFNALMRWTNHKGERKSFLGKALPHVRLGLLSTEFLIECMNKQDAIRTSAEHMSYISQVFASKLQHVSIQTQSSLFKPRRPVSEIEGLLFYEGSSHTVTGPLYFLSIQDGKVRPLESAPFDDWSWITSVTPAGNTIYASCGVLDEYPCQHLVRYDMLSSKWEYMCTLEPNERVKDIIDEYCGCLYIVTQFTSVLGVSLSLIEFDIRYKTMNIFSRFSEYGKPCFRFDDGIYITVRGKGDTQARLRRYSPVTNTWTDLALFLEGRTPLLCCPFQGKLFAFAGYPDATNATIMKPQVYDISRDRWEWGAPLKKVHRRPAALVVLDGCLTFIDTARFPLLEIERYSTDKNAWEACENQLVTGVAYDPQRISFGSGAVKSKPF